MLIGSSDNNHLLFDDDEIMSKSNANTGSILNLQIQGGEGVNVNGSINKEMIIFRNYLMGRFDFRKLSFS